jgi:hypothetical protein
LVISPAPTPRSALLAVWTAAWLAGDVSFDEVIDAMTTDASVHAVVGLRAAVAALSGPAATARAGTDDVGGYDQPGTEKLGAALIAWRAARADLSLALPVPGDVRGLPGPADFAVAALDAGEAAFGAGLALVPAESKTAVIWRAFAVTEPPRDHLQLNEVEHELMAAMRETATLLRVAELSGSRADVGAQLAKARRAGELLNLPRGFLPRAAALVAQAERLSTVLDIALADGDGPAIDRGGVATRSDALRALSTVVRRTRLAAYNCGMSRA